MNSSVPTAETTRSERITEIREAIKTMIDAYESWRVSDLEYFPESLETAISAALNVVLNGDIPSELMSIFSKCVLLGELWAKVLSSEDGLVGADGMPSREFWVAFQAVQELMETSEAVQRSGLEPVAELLAQMRDNPHRHEQIARMYGVYDSERDRWQGPFFYAGGNVNVGLIEQEAANPGSVVPPGFNPLSKRQQEKKSEGISALEKVRRKLAEASGKPVDKDPATIEQLLREGQFPDVIAAVKGVSEKSVRAMADRLGIKIRERDEILTEAYQQSIADDAERKSPTIRDFQEPLSQSVSLDSDPEVDFEPENSESADVREEEAGAEPDDSDDLSTKITGEDLRAFVELSYAENPEVTVAQIKAQIEADGMTVSPISIGRALSNVKSSEN
jgi:hypothetical protein